MERHKSCSSKQRDYLDATVRKVVFINNNVPEYLQGILPEKVETIRPNSRNANNFQIPKCRTNALKNSFGPSTIKLWNDLL